MPSHEKKLRNSDWRIGTKTATAYSSSGGSRKTRTDNRERLGSMSVAFRGGKSLLEELRRILGQGLVHRAEELLGRDVALHEEGQLLLQTRVRRRVELSVPRHAGRRADVLRLAERLLVQRGGVRGDGGRGVLGRRECTGGAVLGRVLGQGELEEVLDERIEGPRTHRHADAGGGDVLVLRGGRTGTGRHPEEVDLVAHRRVELVGRQAAQLPRADVVHGRPARGEQVLGVRVALRSEAVLEALVRAELVVPAGSENRASADLSFLT